MKANAREYPAYPRVGVGALVFKKNRILLVKRGQPPSKDKWTVPGGLVELGESLQDAIKREVWEECDIKINITEVIYTFDYIEKDKTGKIRFHYVLIDYKAEYVEGDLKSRSDVQDARWFLPSEISSVDVAESTLRLFRKLFLF